MNNISEEDKKELIRRKQRIKTFSFLLFVSIISCLLAKFFDKGDTFNPNLHVSVIGLMLIFLVGSIGSYTGYKQASEEIATQWWKYRDRP